ncbi:phosphoribosylformylglycinamidine synthase subunit PurS [Tepiditoga spiralis]|uniref:Phosphoribosylformylglycinamidine synthase subunit PurS n=1 Tax=Tepiditoga spiralis TaxID=2108365 RepID=A0A7G1G8E1_9BACT|nr:phosphoribosylformylglycinamidine synthase subunit PurS [Tepiditoga spiralis]BBE31217.1 phosphoribosylformylglycinamidine synthase subunit PurS [Tepiditoga spiralis]
MKSFKFEVLISLKKGILDPQGSATEKVLKRLNYPVNSVRFGKNIELTVNEETEEKALKIVNEIADKLLSNPVLEKYEIKLLSTEVLA